MKARIIMLIAAAITLAACSNGPSTSEAKAVILNRIDGGAGCSRLAIEDFEKVNGVAQDESHYAVSVKYLLVIKPPQGKQMTQEQYDARLNPSESQPELIQEPERELWAACPQVDLNFVAAVQKGAGEYGQQSPTKRAFLNGFTMEMAETISMVKTDNGWQAGL